jgi:hypothetical protein
MASTLPAHRGRDVTFIHQQAASWQFECAGRKTPAYLATESRKHASTGLSHGEVRMTQNAELELPEEVVGEHSLEEYSPSLSFGPRYKPDSLVEKSAAVSGAVDDMAAVLFGPSKRIRRSEARAHLSATLWLTSLQKPAVFEIVPTENISRAGIQMVTQRFWEPDELVLVSSPPGFFVQGSVVYCRKLPSDDHLLGIRLDAPVEHWSETLGPAAS